MQNVPPPDGVVKRYSRLEDAALPAARHRRKPLPPSSRCLRGCARQRRATRRIDNLLRPSDPATTTGHGVRSRRVARARAHALQRGMLVHRLLQSLPDIAAERRREAAAAISRPQCRRLDRRRTRGARRPGARADRRCALCAGVRAGQPRRSLHRRAAGSARATAGAGVRPDRPAGGDSDRNPDRRLQDQPCPAARHGRAPAAYIRQLALYRAVLAKLYPQTAVRAALLWTETPEMMEIPPPRWTRSWPALSEGMTELDPARSRS